jgi:hypothetical protein
MPEYEHAEDDADTRERAAPILMSTYVRLWRRRHARAYARH